MFHGPRWAGQGLVDECWSLADRVRHAGMVGWQRSSAGWSSRVMPELQGFLSLFLASLLSYGSSAAPK